MADLGVETVVVKAYVLPMEDRVDRLEGDMRDVKSLLSRLEPIIIRIDATLTATLPHLATRAEVASMRSEVNRDISGLGADLSGLGAKVDQRLSDLGADVNQKLSGLRTDVNQKLSDLRVDVDQQLAGLRVEVNQKLSDVGQKLSDLPSRIYMWGVLGVLITAYGAGLAALAVLK